MVRPIRHRLENRVRAHIFLCMLAYYVQWHVTEAWRPLLYADEDQDSKRSRDLVAPAERSEAALHKVQTKQLDDDSAVHSFRTLLDDLARIVSNTCRCPGLGAESPTFTKTPPQHPAAKSTQPAPVHQRVGRATTPDPSLNARKYGRILHFSGGTSA